MNKKGLKLVFLTAVISGISIFVNKFGVKGINPYIFTFGKNLIVLLFLFSTILFFKKFDQLKKLQMKQWLKLVVIGLVGGSIPFLLFFKGLSMTSGASASFIHKTMFVYVIFFAAIFLKEKINKKVLLGTVFLLFGNFLLLKLNNLAFNTGDLLILGAALFWAVENTISKHALKTIQPTLVAFGRMFFGSLFVLIFLIASGNIKYFVTLTVGQVLWAVVTSSFLFAYVITWYSGLKHVKVSIATSVLLLGSPITTLLSFTFLDTAVSLSQLAGIFLIPVGIFIILLSYQPHKHILVE